MSSKSTIEVTIVLLDLTTKLIIKLAHNNPYIFGKHTQLVVIGVIILVKFINIMLKRRLVMTNKLYTIRNIADIAGVSKMTMYRYITSSNISETQQDGKTKLYDDTVKNAIIEGFYARDNNKGTDTHDTAADELVKAKDDQIKAMKAQIELMTNQLNIKDEQIANLTRLTDQQQQLNLKAQDLITSAAPERKRHWWTK